MDDLYVSLYEHVTTGVIRARNGVVHFCNAAARQLTACEPGHPLLHPLLREMAVAACGGLMTLPLRFRISNARVSMMGETEFTEVVITSAPWYASEVLVLLSHPVLVRRDDAPLVDTMARLASRMRGPLEQLAGRRSDSSRSDNAANTAMNTASASDPIDDPSSLLRALTKVQDYAALMSASFRHTDDRMLLRTLLAGAMVRTASTAAAHGVTVRVIDRSGASPAVYGNTEWMSRAVDEVLEHVIECSAPDGLVDVSVAATGTRALLRARIGVAHASPARAVAGHRGLGIGIALARYVVEQHGGSLRFEDDFGDTDIVLDLPSGAPASEDARLAVEQATRFERSVEALTAHSLARAPDLLKNRLS